MSYDATNFVDLRVAITAESVRRARPHGSPVPRRHTRSLATFTAPPIAPTSVSLCATTEFHGARSVVAASGPSVARP